LKIRVLGFGEVKRKGSEVMQREKLRRKKKTNKNRDYRSDLVVVL
jgi:hypothetical protein